MSLGWQEIMLVMIFALIIFGPRRLPDIARQIGRAVREVRKVSSEFEREVKTSFALDEHHSTFVVPGSTVSGSDETSEDEAEAPTVADEQVERADTSPTDGPEPSDPTV